MRSPRRDGEGKPREKPAAGGAKQHEGRAGGRRGRKAGAEAPPPPPPAAREAAATGSPPPQAAESRRGSVEEVAWAGITVAAEAATLGRAARQPRPGGGAGATLTTLGLRRSKSSQEERTQQQSTRFLRAFWHRAYEENITGLAGMVAYNLVLALFPFALLVLFIFGRILQSSDVEASVLNDLQRLFPAVETNTLDNALTPHPRQLDDDRRGRRDRRALDRHLVLGRDGHRVLPHLPRRSAAAGWSRSASPS